MDRLGIEFLQTRARRDADEFTVVRLAVEDSRKLELVIASV